MSAAQMRDRVTAYLYENAEKICLRCNSEGRVPVFRTTATGPDTIPCPECNGTTNPSERQLADWRMQKQRIEAS